MPRCPKDKLDAYAAALWAACQRYEITTKPRLAAFLGQLAWESGDLRWWEEKADGSAYEGRKDLGNVHPGDGKRYKGRGPIQLTGLTNHQAFFKATGIDVVSHPELLLTPEVGCLCAAWFWDSKHLNAFADCGNQWAITKRINGAATDGPPSYHLKRLERVKLASTALDQE